MAGASTPQADELLVGELAVRGAGGMQHAGTDVRHMHEQGGHLEAVDEPGPGFAPALEREGNHAAAPVGQVFGGRSL